MKRVVFLLILFFVIPFATAENMQQTLHFADAETGEMLHDSLVSLTLTSESGTRKHILFMKDDALVISLPSGAYGTTALLDNPSTDAPDYLFTGDIDLQGEATLTLFPVAQINGNVYDASHTLVSGAMLDIHCNNLMTASFPEKTDKYGSFVAYVPIGKCVIAASDNQLVGKNAVTTERGLSYTVDIVLDTGRTERQYLAWILVIFIIFIALFFLVKKLVRIPKRKKSTDNRQLTSVLKTLSDADQKVVRYVNEQRQTTSSSIRHALKIPRTSLARLLERLEGKKIVELERHGKMKKVRLADWLKKK